MAKINGFELKSVKHFRGHEGEDCVQGKIYLNGKNVGWFSSSYMMGPMDIHFDNIETDRAFEKTVKTYIDTFPELFDGSGYFHPDVKQWFDSEMMINEMLIIADWERLVKKAYKDGYRFCTMQIDISNPEKYRNGEQRTSMRISRIPYAIKEPDEGIKILRVIESLDQFNIIVGG